MRITYFSSNGRQDNINNKKLAVNAQELSNKPQRKEEIFQYDWSFESLAKNDIKNELESLTGLDEVKKTVEELEAYLIIKKQRLLYGISTEPLSLHMIFKGNPGTGKSTVARILGKLLYVNGVLPKDSFVEVERADLVGEYIGHTAQKTRTVLNNSLGGLLFIDEAYSLGRGGEYDFGKEAIDVLVKAMEDLRDKFVLVLAGYPKEMDWFLKLNPGLNSRFPLHIEFPDYEVNELLEIASNMAREKHYQISADGISYLKSLFSRLKKEGSLGQSNARFVRNLLEKACRKQALRLVSQKSYTRENLIIINARDLKNASC